MVCVDPEIMTGSTNNLGKQWCGKDRVQVKEALLNAVKGAIRNPETIKYPKTFQLFQILFPKILKPKKENKFKVEKDWYLIFYVVSNKNYCK